MGDRANIVIDAGDGDCVFLYAHWSGSNLPFDLQAALQKRWRWDDASYLARIIFCQMVKGHEDDETGFGISAQLGDNEHPLLVVDVPGQAVRLTNESRNTVFKSWGFESYCKAKPEKNDWGQSGIVVPIK